MSAGIALSAIAAVTLVWTASRRVPGWALLALLCAPAVLVVLPADFRILSFHGFLHSGIVYGILTGGVPPTDPLLAGEPLLYPWAHHFAVAELTRLFGVAPPLLFAAIDVGALAATAIALFALGRELFDDRATALLGACLGLYGLAALPVALVLDAATPFALESRLIPIQKFTNANSNPLGILCYAVGLLSLARWADAARAGGRTGLVWIGAAVAAAGFLYPLAWLPLVGVAAVAGAALAAKRWVSLRAAAELAAVLTLGSALSLPYLLPLQLGRSPAAGLAPDLGVDHLLRNAANLFAVAAGWLVLLVVVRGPLRARAIERPGAFLVLSCSAVLPGAAFLFTHTAVHSEYKFLLLCGMTLAVAGALAVKILLDRSLAAAALLAWLLLLPAGGFFAQLASSDWSGPFAVTEDGPRLRAGDGPRRALHDWIRAQTAPDAVFIDTELDIPVFAWRSLFVAMDVHPATSRTLAGWGLQPSVFLLEVIGHPAEAVAERRALTRALLVPGQVAPGGDPVARLRALAGSATLYAVTRGADSARTLTADDRFERVYSGDPIRVFRLRPVASAPAQRSSGRRQ